MEIKKFVIKNRTGYENRTDCWFRTGNTWHQTVPSNCLLLTLDPNVKSIINENLFVILDSKDYGNTYGKTVHSLEEHNIILSTDVYSTLTGAAEQNGPENSIGYFHTNNKGHKHNDVTLHGGKYSGESFYSLFNRYAVGAYTKDYILANSLLLSTKDISSGNIQKIAEDLNYFLFIDNKRRGKLDKEGLHNHRGTDYTYVERVTINNSQQNYTKASTTGVTAYSEHSHRVNYNISDSSHTKGDKPKKYLVTYYNKTTNNLYFDELPIGTIMLFIDEYNDYMYNWIPLECSKDYCCNIVYDYNSSKDIFQSDGVTHHHTAEILSSSLVKYSSGKYGGSNMRSWTFQDHSHNFTLGKCSYVYLEPYGLMLKPYIKISDRKPNL